VDTEDVGALHRGKEWVKNARDHFYGLLEAKPDLVGFALFDSIAKDLPPGGPLWQVKWGRREIENYLCYPETLIEYSLQTGDEEGPLFEAAEQDRRRGAMQEANCRGDRGPENAAAIRSLRR
jgi:hypothetical protein